MIALQKIPSTGPTAPSLLKRLHGSPSVHLDALRGFAAFSVLLFHWRRLLFVNYAELGHHNLLVAAAYVVCGLGEQWVIVFFVLSGYLVGGSVLRSVATGHWSWRGYLLTRLTRLYIVLLPALLLGGILDCAGIHLAGSQAHYASLTLDRFVQADLTLPTLAANCLFLQNIKLPGLGGHSFPVYGSNGPLWSLCNEFWYYLAFPLLVLLLTKGRFWWVRVACGMGLIGWVWFVGSYIALLGIPWLMGVMIVYLPPFPARGPWTRGIATGTALVVFAVSLPVAVKIHHFGWIADALLGLIVTFLIWVTLHCATAPLSSFYIKLAQRSSHSSYTLYLTHFPLLVFFIAFLHLPRTVPSWHMFLVSMGLLAAILLYAQLIYEIFEKHTEWVRNWIKPYVIHEKTARGGPQTY
jgi:peptidoglycan/LPS O-acetylase OafA/YrhL